MITLLQLRPYTGDRVAPSPNHSVRRALRIQGIVLHYCRQGLALDDVVGHEAIAPGRKTDPVGWDWARFRTMVRHQLHANVERGRGVVYDRRGAERVAADEAERYGAAEVLTSSVAPQAESPPNGTLPGGSAPGDAALDAGWISAPPPVRRRRIAAPPRKRVVALATPKPLVRSRMLWVNGMTVLAAGGMLIGDTLDLAHQVGITVPEVLAKWALFIVGLVNIILRLRTTRPLTYGPGAPPAAESYPLPDENESGDDQDVTGVRFAG